MGLKFSPSNRQHFQGDDSDQRGDYLDRTFSDFHITRDASMGFSFRQLTDIA